VRFGEPRNCSISGNCIKSRTSFGDGEGTHYGKWRAKCKSYIIHGQKRSFLGGGGFFPPKKKTNRVDAMQTLVICAIN
jgi:hypothetical protein